ncbi:MAG TPA: hypothetical protein VFV30_12630 [Novosphingobium sp.]|nr:hypothetical protein [Novosphingobium sp.]
MRVSLYRSDVNGLFRFEEEHWVWEDIPGYGRNEYWSVRHGSGLYETFEEAEQDALRTIPWLRA